MEIRTFSWHGIPRGQGRPRFTRAGKAYKAEKDRAYEQSIKAAYLEKYGREKPIAGAFRMSVGVWMPIPRTASRCKRANMLTGRIQHTTKPDLDNVVKAVMDALNGVAYSDDKDMVQINALKIYSTDPGLYVMISPVEVGQV